MKGFTVAVPFIHLYTHSHTDVGRAVMQGANQTTRSNRPAGFSVLTKHMARQEPNL